MEVDHYTFADSTNGLEFAWATSVHLRRFGYKTRLATRQWGRFTVYTVIATPPPRPTRAERGCLIGGDNGR
jgi:hypothetical protein